MAQKSIVFGKNPGAWAKRIFFAPPNAPFLPIESNSRRNAY